MAATEVEKVITEWATHLKSNKELAQAAAVAALNHCFCTRDVRFLERMKNVIETEGKQFVRLDPFIVWLNRFAPVKSKETLVDGKTTRKFVLNNDKFDAKLLLLPEATATLWWTMSKEIVVAKLESVEVAKRFNQVITSMRNAKRFEPTPAALALISKMETTLRTAQGIAA